MAYTKGGVHDKFAQHIDHQHIDQKIADLTETRAAIAELAAACSGEGATTGCPIIKTLNATNGGMR